MSADTVALAAQLKWDRKVVITALTIMAFLAWSYVFWLAVHMAMPPATIIPDDMAGMDMGAIGKMVAPGFRSWAPTDFVFAFAMWSVMMIGMMTPSVAPMVLIYARVGREARLRDAPFASTGWFYAGYLVVWVAFSAFATLAQWTLVSLALLTPMLAAVSTLFGGSILILVGVYQLTPFKDTCLRSCQAPLGFLMKHGGFRSEPAGALYLGVVHGAYCCGCCAALMALLFVGGVMNVLWIAGLTGLVLLEKVLPFGRLIPRLSGGLMSAAGIWLLLQAV